MMELRECEYPLDMNNLKSLHNISTISYQLMTFSGNHLSSVEAEIILYNMVNSVTEYDNTMRCSKKIISQCLPVTTSLNLGSEHSHKGNKLYNVFMV